MQTSHVDNMLWAAGFTGNLLLLFVLIFRGRWRQFPVFTTLIGYYVVEAIFLFFVFRLGTNGQYKMAYWTTFTIDALLQIALIFEIARVVLRPTGTWVRDARSSFLIWGTVGAVVGLLLTYVVKPTSEPGFGAWGVRTFLFTSLLFCELFLAMMFVAQRLGLVWRNHVMGLGQGLTAWALISAGVDAAHSYVGSAYIHDFTQLEHVRSLAYLGAAVYWMVTFWVQEPERRPLSPEMQKYLVALHKKVQYDSTQVSSAQNFR